MIRPVITSPSRTAPLCTPRVSGPLLLRSRSMPSSTFWRSSRSLRLKGGLARMSVTWRAPSSARGRSSPNWSATDGATAATMRARRRTTASMVPPAARGSGTPRGARPRRGPSVRWAPVRAPRRGTRGAGRARQRWPPRPVRRPARGLEARQVAAELRQHVLRLEPELLEQPAVALGVDLVGQLLLGLAGLVLVAVLADEVQHLVLGDLHATSPFVRSCGVGVRPRAP